MQVASLGEYLDTRRAQIDGALARFLPSAPHCPSGLNVAMRYSLDAGGKRLRPILTLAAAEAVTAGAGHSDQAIAVALPDGWRVTGRGPVTRKCCRSLCSTYL